MIYVIYVLVGIISGIFGGLGMGGGTLLIPLLTIFLGFDQKLSQGINLLSFLVMAIFSLIIHYKNGYIATKHLFWIIIPAVIFSVLGAFAMTLIPSKILKMIFGVFLCVLAVIEFIKVFKKDKKNEKIAKKQFTKFVFYAIFIISFCTGGRYG